MTHVGLAIGVLYALVLGSFGLGAFVLLRAYGLHHAAAKRNEARAAQGEAELLAVRRELDACARRLWEIEQQAGAAPAPFGGKAALNLTKRSQALRMHRLGESAERIATALEIPHQEVDLLLKVHRIVIGDL